MTDDNNKPGHNPDDIEMRPRPSYEEAYRQLKAGFITRLGNSITVIDNIMSRQQVGPLSTEDLERAMHLGHGLAGSGTTFGFPAVTDAGRKLDAFLERLLRSLPDEEAMGDEDRAIFESLMTDLKKSCESALADKSEKTGPTKAPLSKSPQDEIKETYHVLLVDDDESILDIITLKLRQIGVRVSIARTGDAALRVIAKEIPDLIVLDIMMPGISGHEVLRRLKQDADFVNVPVIMLTSKTEQKDVVSALHGGAIDYVIKPVDPEKLVARINRTLDAGRFTVMIADNDHLILQLLDSKYRNRGFKVMMADDGKDAWNQILKNLPDLIILDRMMPGLDGLAVLKNIREEQATAHIPVIVLSARKEQRDIDMGMKFGANDYMVKPFLPDDLLNRSLKLLKKQ